MKRRKLEDFVLTEVRGWECPACRAELEGRRLDSEEYFASRFKCRECGWSSRPVFQEDRQAYPSEREIDDPEKYWIRASQKARIKIPTLGASIPAGRLKQVSSYLDDLIEAFREYEPSGDWLERLVLEANKETALEELRRYREGKKFILSIEDPKGKSEVVTIDELLRRSKQDRNPNYIF